MDDVTQPWRRSNGSHQYDNAERFLGSFVALWLAWDKSWPRTQTLDEDHFYHAIYHQLLELTESEVDHKPKELVDIISITLNWLHWLGYAPEDIAQTVMDRARTKYVDTDGIIDRYEAMRDRGEA